MEPVQRHNHQGTGSEKLDAGRALLRSPQPPITTAIPGHLTSGGAMKLMTSDEILIANLIQRVADLERVLLALGVLRSNVV